MAGVPATNMALYRRIQFLVGDPVALIESPVQEGFRSTLILRDIEMDRARQKAAVDEVACPKDYVPATGLSGDRETATAQAAAECCKRNQLTRVVVDRSLPMIFTEMLLQAGLEVQCDIEWGILERRQKSDRELDFLRSAQKATEQVMERACRLIATAAAAKDGTLMHDGHPLTSERVRAFIDQWLIELGFSNPLSIVAGGPQGADCHDYGSGPLKTEQPVIVDIFPRDKQTLYNGDCTRTVVHGKISNEIQRMHEAVVAAKAAATAATRAGVTGESVHRATIQAIETHGYRMGLPPQDAGPDFTSMTHGTGHGIGLDVHEPPLLDIGGPVLLPGDVLTIEPGLYCPAIGGIRVEDMVAVTQTGCENFNQLPEGLDWT